MTEQERSRLIELIENYAGERYADGVANCCHPKTEQARKAMIECLEACL